MIDFSVIIPVYNSEKYLGKCIESLLYQKYENWEAILIDDGSTDKSSLLCDEYANKDSRIKVIHIKNSGVSNARNLGIINSSGKRIMFLDSDDYLDRNTFLEISKIINDYDYDIVACALKTNSNNPLYFPLSNETFAKEGNIEMLYDIRLRAFSGWSVEGKKDLSMHFIVTKLIKKELIIKNNIEFFRELKYHEDTLFCIEILEKAKSIAVINKYYYIRTLHDSSASVSFCPTISEGNTKALYLFRNFIQKYHSNDKNYKIAYAKYQLAWFIQCLKLDFLHKSANYSKRQSIDKINILIESGNYTPSIPIIDKQLKLIHKILILLLKFKCGWMIYHLIKFIS